MFKFDKVVVYTEVIHISTFPIVKPIIKKPLTLPIALFFCTLT